MEEEFNEIDSKNAWLSVYQQIRLESYEYKFTCKDARKIENKNLNRYRDVNPYDHARVRLKRGDQDYINASLVEVSLANRAYILSQGPLPNTAGHFWLMVWEQKTKAVVMLNKVIEKNTIKCHQYWPLGKSNGGNDDIVMTEVGLKVTFLSEKDVDNYTIRILQLKDLESNEQREILQFHYTSWPDFGVPESPSAFLNFLLAVRASGGLSNNVGPVVVHCSAGIGRSGTFCLVDSCLVLIKESRDPNSVDVQKMLLEMRKYRMGLIQTPDQLRFSYLAIIKGAKMLLNKDKEKSNQVPLKTESTEVDNKHADENGHVDENRIYCDKNNKTNEADDDEELSLIDEKLDESSRILSTAEEETDQLINNTSSQDSEQSDSVPPPLPPRVGKPTEQNAESNNVDEIIANDISNDKEYLACHSTRPLSNSEREFELRKRRRRERNDQTSQLVQGILKKQKEAENSSRRRLLFKKLSLGVVLLMSTGLIVYRYYLKD